MEWEKITGKLLKARRGGLRGGKPAGKTMNSEDWPCEKVGSKTN
jgi:hypothetical protein